MSFADIADSIKQWRSDACEWLHLVETSTNNISTKKDYNCALNGFLSGHARAMEKIKDLLNTKIDDLVRKIENEERESRMWQYYVGAKDTLLELVDRLK